MGPTRDGWLCRLAFRQRDRTRRSRTHTQDHRAARTGVCKHRHQAAANYCTADGGTTRDLTTGRAVRCDRSRLAHTRGVPCTDKVAPKGFRCGGRTVPGNAVSVGRQDFAGPGLFRPPANIAAGCGHFVSARQ